MKNKGKLFIGIILIVVIIICIILFYPKKKEDVQDKHESTHDDVDININTDDGDEDIIWSNYENREIDLSKSFTITEGGTYFLSGTIEDGFITINTSDDVKLVLNNVHITNESGPAIYIEKANNTLIYLEKGSVNTLEDGTTYKSFAEDVNGTIYSKDDLVFDGEGRLDIKAHYGDGIVSKDDLKIINGNYNIESNDDGIRGKDSVYILNGTFHITSGGDAIKSSNDTDTEKGFIKIENGQFDIESTLDGIQAENKLLIQNGEFNIKTGGGCDSNNSLGNFERGPMNYGATTSESAKGMKAGDNLVIEGGTFVFDTLDDAIHSNNYALIQDGNIIISSSDDGIHADTELIIDGGSIDIKQSYEGLEATKMTINNGDIKLLSLDDGINVAGGADNSSMGGRRGQNNFNMNTDNILTINGGNIYVNATGDGIDVNGSGYINGGYIVVDGPTNSGNGALDYDGEFVVNRGTIMAGGSSGMSQGISNNSNQYSVSIFFNNNIEAGSIVKITDSKGKEVLSYTGSKTIASLVLSCESFAKNETYSILINGQEYDTLTIESTSTNIGNGGMQRPNGMRPRRI